MLRQVRRGGGGGDGPWALTHLAPQSSLSRMTLSWVGDSCAGSRQGCWICFQVIFESHIFFDEAYFQMSCPFTGHPQWLSRKEYTCSAGAAKRCGSILGLGRSSGGGHGNPLQCSCLENPHGQRSLELYSPCGHGVRHNWSHLACTHFYFTLGVKFFLLSFYYPLFIFLFLLLSFYYHTRCLFTELWEFLIIWISSLSGIYVMKIFSLILWLRFYIL